MNMPARLSVVGDFERPDHFHLPQSALCYFWGEYTPHNYTNGLKWDYSATNRLIANFKKKPDRRGQADWQYKQRAIMQIAAAFAQMWKWPELKLMRPTFIPMPPSKARNDPMYDGRMLEMLSSLNSMVGHDLDIRDCLSFNGNCATSHETTDRPTPDNLYATLSFDATVGRSGERPGVIFLFDDMLTSGAHYVAASRKLGEVFPEVKIYGQFIARRRLPNPFEDLI